MVSKSVEQGVILDVSPSRLDLLVFLLLGVGLLRCCLVFVFWSFWISAYVGSVGCCRLGFLAVVGVAVSLMVAGVSFSGFFLFWVGVTGVWSYIVVAGVFDFWGREGCNEVFQWSFNMLRTDLFW